MTDLVDFAELVHYNEFVRVPAELRKEIVDALLEASRTKSQAQKLSYQLQADGIYLTSN